MRRKPIISYALAYLAKKYAVVLLHDKSKQPIDNGWQNIPLQAEDIQFRLSGEPPNIGVALGVDPACLIDIDVDCPEALALASHLLPPTNAIFGRKSKPKSHWLYRCGDSIPKTEQFQSVDHEMMVELRSTGSQTVFPPSVHPSGETVEFHENGDPLLIDGESLRRKVRMLAAGCTLVKTWRKSSESGESGIRHKLALAGAMYRAGFDKDATIQLITSVATVARDEEVSDRLRAVESTWEKCSAGEPATGVHTLAELIDSKAPDKLTHCIFRQPADRPPDLSVLDGLPERAKVSSTALDATGVIKTMVWICSHEPGRHDDLRRQLIAVDVGSRVFEPHVREMIRRRNLQLLKNAIGILENSYFDQAEAQCPYASWRSPHNEYLVKRWQTSRLSMTQHSKEQRHRLGNFSARIVSETAIDDGAEATRYYEIDGKLGNGRHLPAVCVPVQKFQQMNWPTEIRGSGPSIAAGLGAKDHMRADIEEFSGLTVPRDTVFRHLGRRKPPEGRWAFLHAGGAVGVDGFSVDVDHDLLRYLLPLCPDDYRGRGVTGGNVKHE